MDYNQVIVHIDRLLSRFVRYFTHFFFYDFAHTGNVFVALPYFMIWSCGQIESSILRKGIMMFSLVFSVHLRAWCCLSMILLFLGIDLGFRYLLPWVLRRYEFQSNPVVETALKRTVRAWSGPTSHLLHDMILTYTGFQRGDGSEPFTDEERALLKRTFHDFGQTSYIESMIFTPFVIMRYNGRPYLHFAWFYQRNSRPDPLEACSICREHYGEMTLRLQCNHEFCPECILSWNSENPNCPVCRRDL